MLRNTVCRTHALSLSLDSRVSALGNRRREAARRRAVAARRRAWALVLSIVAQHLLAASAALLSLDCIGSLHCLAESLTLHRRTLHWLDPRLDASVTAFTRC